jgi:hypothetical protein
VSNRFYLELHSRDIFSSQHEENSHQDDDDLVLGAIEFDINHQQQRKNNITPDDIECKNCSYQITNFHKPLYVVKGVPDEVWVVVRSV